MTKVLFLHGCRDRLVAAISWLANERGQRRAMVYLPDTTAAERLDRLLWTTPATGFFPHCAAGAPLAAETPILIGDTPDTAATDEVLVNLSDIIPPGFARFHELVEIVGASDTEKIPGRERYRYYRDRGYALENRSLGDQE